MNVQLAPDVAELLEPLACFEFDRNEVVNQTLRIWFGLMQLCSRDPEADAMFMQVVARAAALAATDTKESS